MSWVTRERDSAFCQCGSRLGASVVLPTTRMPPRFGVPAAAGAAANAWARATGKQPRNFPLNEYGA